MGNEKFSNEAPTPPLRKGVVGSSFLSVVNEISVSGGGKMVYDPYEKHHYLFLKGRGMESIRLTTNKAKKLFDLAKEKELLDMGRVKLWF
jgi:hypothetical protein